MVFGRRRGSEEVLLRELLVLWGPGFKELGWRAGIRSLRQTVLIGLVVVHRWDGANLRPGGRVVAKALCCRGGPRTPQIAVQIRCELPSRDHRSSAVRKMIVRASLGSWGQASNCPDGPSVTLPVTVRRARLSGRNPMGICTGMGLSCR